MLYYDRREDNRKSTYSYYQQGRKSIFSRSYIPIGSKIFLEEIEKAESVPGEGTLFNMGTMVKDRVYIGHVLRESE